eukprot:scaffold10678_cov130-Skeletonema_marinoi.AAC.7
MKYNSLRKALRLFRLALTLRTISNALRITPFKYTPLLQYFAADIDIPWPVRFFYSTPPKFKKLSQIWGACSFIAIQSATIMNDE